MIDSNLIFDIGARGGGDTEFYLEKGFKVVAIEVSPTWCEALGERFSEKIETGQLQVLNLAIAEAPGSVHIEESWALHRSVGSSHASRRDAFGRPPMRSIRVEAEPLAELFGAFGVPRYCKLSVDDAAVAALRSMQGLEDLPEHVSLPSAQGSWNDLMQTFVTLGDLGYRRFKPINQALVPFQSQPDPALEGAMSDHAFQPGDTGLFGDESPGRWLDAFEAIETYKTIFIGYVLNQDQGRRRRDPQLPPADAYHLHAAR